MAKMNTSEYLPVTVSFKNVKGQDAPVQGKPVWASSDETIVTVEVSEDGLSAKIMSVAPSDLPARVTVTADADMGEGVREIVGVSENIMVVADPADEASVVMFTFGDPVVKA